MVPDERHSRRIHTPLFCETLVHGWAQLLAIAWPTLISLSLAVVATLTKRMWVHALAIGWILTVAVANNLFISIGR